MALSKQELIIPVKVQPILGEAVGEKHTYFPMVCNFLRPGHQLPFDVYRRSQEDKLELFLAKGKKIFSDIQAQIQAEGLQNRLYIRGDQRSTLLVHEEEMLLEVLDDGQLPIQEKCQALQHVTISLAQQVHENPTSDNIRRQKRNIHRLVDFSLHDEYALKGLVRLADHDYYTYSHSVNVGLYGLAIAMAHFGGRLGHNLHEIAAAFSFMISANAG